MNTNLFQIDQHGSGFSLIPIDPRDNLYQENWMQNLLINHPGILPVAEIEPVFYPLIPIGREVSTNTGVIDNLYISQQGYPVIVETKLWRNPEARRDVFAQSIDYAVSLSKWSFHDLDQLTLRYTGNIGHPYKLIKWIEEYSHEPLEVDTIYFEENVSKNLRLGRFLILMVGDKIRSTVVDLLSHFNDYPHLAFNIALVELHCYKYGHEKDFPLFVVPSIKAKTQIVERTIVQVNVSLEGETEISASQEKMKDEKSGRVPLTEDEYWNRLRAQNPESLPVAKILIEHFREKEQTFLTVRDDSISVRMLAPESGQKISLFFIRTDGVIECWHKAIDEQFEKGGLDKQIMYSFVNDLKKLLTDRTKTLSIKQQASKINPDEFISIIEKFVDNILTSQIE